MYTALILDFVDINLSPLAIVHCFLLSG